MNEHARVFLFVSTRSNLFSSLSLSLPLFLRPFHFLLLGFFSHSTMSSHIILLLSLNDFMTGFDTNQVISSSLMASLLPTVLPLVREKIK